MTRYGRGKKTGIVVKILAAPICEANTDIIANYGRNTVKSVLVAFGALDLAFEAEPKTCIQH